MVSTLLVKSLFLPWYWSSKMENNICILSSRYYKPRCKSMHNHKTESHVSNAPICRFTILLPLWNAKSLEWSTQTTNKVQVKPLLTSWLRSNLNEDIFIARLQKLIHSNSLSPAISSYNTNVIKENLNTPSVPTRPSQGQPPNMSFIILPNHVLPVFSLSCYISHVAE